MASPCKSRTRSDGRCRDVSRRTFVGLTLLAVMAVLAPGARGQDADVYAVVASSDVPTDDLTLDELRRIYTFSRRYWASGLPVTILFTEDGLHDDSVLTRVIYRTDFPSIRRMILEKLYRSELDLAPKVVANDRSAVDFVASGRGLISLVHRGAIGDAEVKVLKIDGLFPGDDGYALKE